MMTESAARVLLLNLINFSNKIVSINLISQIPCTPLDTNTSGRVKFNYGKKFLQPYSDNQPVWHKLRYVYVSCTTTNVFV